MGFPRAGSNPADCEIFSCFFAQKMMLQNNYFELWPFFFLKFQNFYFSSDFCARPELQPGVRSQRVSVQAEVLAAGRQTGDPGVAGTKLRQPDLPQILG